MALVWVDPRYLDNVWPKAAPLLEKAVECNLGEETLEQVRAKVAFRQAELLVFTSGADPDLATGAAVVEFIQHPNYRVAHVSYAAGVSSRSVFEQLRDWSKAQGASVLEGYGSDAIARLWRRYGFEKAYNLVRVQL